MLKRVMSIIYRRHFGHSPLESVVINGVIFDMDGTLTQPILNFSEMRQRIGIASSQDVLTYVSSISNEEDQRKAMKIIEDMEEEASKRLTLQTGVFQLLDYLASKQIKQALLTRNSKHSADIFVDKLHSSIDTSLYTHLPLDNIFSQVISREFKPWKPDPAPVCHICNCWGLLPQNVLVVGDGRDDIISGHKAGTLTALLVNKPKEGTSTFQPTHSTPYDIIVTSLTELLDILKHPITVTGKD